MEILNKILSAALVIWIINFLILRNEYEKLQGEYLITLEKHQQALIDFIEFKKADEILNNK